MKIILITIFVVGVFSLQPAVGSTVEFSTKPGFSFGSRVIGVANFADTQQFVIRLTSLLSHPRNGSGVRFNLGFNKEGRYLSWLDGFGFSIPKIFHIDTGSQSVGVKDVGTNFFNDRISRAGIDISKYWANSIFVVGAVLERMNNYFRSMSSGEFLAGDLSQKMSDYTKGQSSPEEEYGTHSKPKGISFDLVLARILSFFPFVLIAGLVFSVSGRANFELYAGRTFISRAEFFLVTGGLLGSLFCVAIGLFVFIWAY